MKIKETKCNFEMFVNVGHGSLDSYTIFNFFQGEICYDLHNYGQAVLRI